MSHQNCQVYSLHEKRLEKALAEYKNGNFSNPILQLHIYDQLALHSHTWTHLEHKILMYLCQQTIAQGRIRYGLGAGDIGCAIGVDKRSVKRVRDKLAAEDWIKVYESCCRNKLELNIEKIMALGKKFTESKQKECSDVTPGDTMSPLTSKSYIIKDNIPKKSNTFCVTEIKNPKSKKAMIKTWKNALLHSDFADKYSLLVPSAKDYHKLTSIFGNEHIWRESDNRKKIVGKWPDSPQKFHECEYWAVRHWAFIRFRLGKPKFPNNPDIGWFVSCLKEIYELWLSECGDESDDNVIRLKEKANAEKMRQKWKKYLDDKE